jgi:uncharacterized protein (TIGR02246 family)
MKRAMCLAFAICFSPIAVAGPQEDGQAVFDEFLSDFSSANPDAVAANFTSSALFWGTNKRDLISGTSSIREYFSVAFKGRGTNTAKATSVGNVSVEMISENVMAVSGIWQVERTVDGKVVNSQFRNSLTLVKRDGRWLIGSFANSPRPAAK